MSRFGTDGVNIVGAGPAGALLGILLMRRGLGAVRLWDRRSDPRRSREERGRSINLALAARGIRALEHAGLMDKVRPLLIPMRGRMIHDRSGATSLHPYGQRAHEVIHSVSRAALNRLLIEEAARHQDVTIRFDQNCVGADLATDKLTFRNEVSGAQYQVDLTPTIAADGAGSAIRTSLLMQRRMAVREDWLDHAYKELTIPPVDGAPALDPNALHIWPRGGFMLIALPNTDHSFTATLFLAECGGPRSFSALPDSQAVLEFFAEEFPDVVPLMPNLAAEFLANPEGRLGTVHATPWCAGGQLTLLGDAAHAIVPFHGQGMNAAFEDCLALDSLLDEGRDWAEVFSRFEELRRPNTEAIAGMALENYQEMRDSVLAPDYQRHKQLALELERRFPDRFIPRYAMVMFHPEIPYAEALRRGAVQAQILKDIDPGGVDIDWTRAERLVTERLPALPAGPSRGPA